jgi:hypothetical protein
MTLLAGHLMPKSDILVGAVSIVLHVLISSDENSGMFLERRTVQVLREDVGAVDICRDPLDLDETVFFEVAKEELTNFDMTKASSSAPVVRQIFRALVVHLEDHRQLDLQSHRS